MLLQANQNKNEIITFQIGVNVNPITSIMEQVKQRVLIHYFVKCIIYTLCAKYKQNIITSHFNSLTIYAGYNTEYVKVIGFYSLF